LRGETYRKALHNLQPSHYGLVLHDALEFLSRRNSFLD
jgi:hypothetical protein